MSRRYLGKKPFDLSARVPMQLGRESISSSTVAVSELIKMDMMLMQKVFILNSF